ncbi:MAG: hypothetical protein AAFZ07_19175 [Actinomycetota bacterium]
MKAGTTTLFDWLGQGDDVCLPTVKEPAHLAAPSFGQAEQREYRQLFATDALTGEASVRYGWPDEAPVVARRLLTLPRRPRLLFLAREPEDRLRSDYRHGVLRGRERRPFADAVADPAASVVQRSRYSLTLGTYRRVLGQAPFVVRSEDLFGDDHATWDAVVAHLGLDPRPRPTNARNRTAERPATTALGRAIFDRPVAARAVRRLEGAAGAVPAPVRTIGRRLLQREADDTVDDLLATADAPLPAAPARVLVDERERLADDWGLRW